jgi:hypothetical protein
MATKVELLAAGLVDLNVLSENQKPWRNLLAFPTFVDWIDGKLPLIQDSYSDSTPKEQVGAFFEAFALGEPLEYRRQYREVHPRRFGAWELKTPAIRIFGWFSARNTFVCTFGEAADHIKKHDLVRGFLNETTRLREGLTHPEFVPGVKYDDILSDAPNR